MYAFLKTGKALLLWSNSEVKIDDDDDDDDDGVDNDSDAKDVLMMMMMSFVAGVRPRCQNR